MLDPLVQSHDWNMLNNQRTFGRAGWLLLAPQRPTDSYLDTYFSRRSARDRLTVGWAPVAWYNDAAGWTLGGRVRQDYLGRFELNEAWLSVGTGWGPQADRTNLNGRLALRNPVGLRMTGWSQDFGAAWEEGRAETRVGVVRRFRARAADSTVRMLGASLSWLTVTSPVYLDDRSWDDAGTVELMVSGTAARPDRKGPARVTAGIAAGYAYPNSTAAPRAVGYGRLVVQGSARRSLSSRLGLGARAFVGLVAAADPVPTQRRMTLAGADPYQRFGSPFLRSRGSLFATDGFHFHAPGGAGLRGLDPSLSAPHALGATIETEYALSRRPPGGILSRIALAAFVDGALADGDLAGADDRLTSAADAGVGVRLDHTIGQTAFQTRLDLPLWVSRPELAQDDGPSSPVGFRWTFGLTPPF
jgi:hypothetical protein